MKPGRDWIVLLWICAVPAFVAVIGFPTYIAIIRIIRYSIGDPQ